MKPATRLPANNEGGTSLSHLTSRFCCHHHQKQGDSVEPPVTTHFSTHNPPFPPKILWQVLMLLLFRLTSNFWGRNAGKYGSKKLKWGSVINGRVANES